MEYRGIIHHNYDEPCVNLKPVIILSIVLLSFNLCPWLQKQIAPSKAINAQSHNQTIPTQCVTSIYNVHIPQGWHEIDTELLFLLDMILYSDVFMMQ